ncbi:hypothetical protein [Amycolatopsis sp. cmx-4-68]|uniref:hypothetical protein n=1 Tax=Amycolatopsis sp. cmx-4-68 TaxID=2790938 RepID=UPI00397B6AE2
MAWECSDCNAREEEDGKVVVDAVCHHCGKPLCRDHQQPLIDDAFATSESDGLIPWDRIAIHCESCRRIHHLRATVMDKAAR